MVDIIPSSQLVIGNGAFSIVYRARLKLVSLDSLSYKSFLGVILGLENVNISCINRESFLGDKLVVQMCRNPFFKNWTLPYLHSCGKILTIFSDIKQITSQKRDNLKRNLSGNVIIDNIKTKTNRLSLFTSQGKAA